MISYSYKNKMCLRVYSNLTILYFLHLSLTSPNKQRYPFNAAFTDRQTDRQIKLYIEKRNGLQWTFKNSWHGIFEVNYVNVLVSNWDRFQCFPYSYSHQNLISLHTAKVIIFSRMCIARKSYRNSLIYLFIIQLKVFINLTH